MKRERDKEIETAFKCSSVQMVEFVVLEYAKYVILKLGEHLQQWH